MGAPRCAHTLSRRHQCNNYALCQSAHTSAATHLKMLTGRASATRRQLGGTNASFAYDVSAVFNASTVFNDTQAAMVKHRDRV